MLEHAHTPKLTIAHFWRELPVYRFNIDTNFCCAVWEENGKIVGFVAAFMSQTLPDRAYSHFIGVDPEFRRKGIGQDLYLHLFSVVKALGGTSVHAVTAPTNINSLAFHRHLGFCFDPGKPDENGIPVVENYDGLGGARVLMTRRLGGDHGRE
ncbi:MAG: GNAT family N-acetyltransferase [Gammaproteobacteria bacterium]|nr:GNAT family N-acetyltransferase [Gammaproteobacteria bacterium]